MHVTGGDGDPECISELSSSAAREQPVRKAGPSGISEHPLEDNGAADEWLSQRRLDALRAIDEGSFSSFRFKVYLVACIGFLTDAYDIFALNLTFAMCASEFAPRGVFDRLMPTVFTPEGWGKLADSLAALVWGRRGGARESGQGRAERRRKERANRRRGRGLK
ncbi:hypothetical protein DFH94DRAFT_737840 [Russula ochroleuca]|uniref:Phosphate transporter n=1 Tax=Russula ochroleuca TaxID=152965 RepID=A0A9P5TA64_9AGAM|nr:hypothetical protein DFH94DRAFT_737840 [Russula ochroleuca]